MEPGLDPETDQFHGAECRDHDVVGGQLFMKQPLTVQRGEGVRQFPDHPSRFQCAERAVSQQVGQRAAVRVLTNDVATDPARVVVQTDRVQYP